MSNRTAIQWADATFNPWIGCTQVSPGCAHCYAESETFARAQRSKGRELWGKGKERHRTSEATWKQPLKWNREIKLWAEHVGRYVGRRRKIFCGSMCDWLDNEVPIEWLADLLRLIHSTPNIDWLLLTKRPENWQKRLLEMRGKRLDS